MLTVCTALVLVFSSIYFSIATLGTNLINGDSIFGLDKALFIKLVTGPLTFFKIVGVTQVITNVFYLLLLWKVVQLTKARLGVMVSLLMIEFGFNLTFSLICTLSWVSYKPLWREYLSWT